MMASGATPGVPHRHSDVVQPDARVGRDDRFMVPPWCRWNHAWELCRNGVTATIRCIGDGLTTLAFRRSPPASLCDQTSACPATSVSGPGTPPFPTTGPAPSMPRGSDHPRASPMSGRTIESTAVISALLVTNIEEKHEHCNGSNTGRRRRRAERGARGNPYQRHGKAQAVRWTAHGAWKGDLGQELHPTWHLVDESGYRPRVRGGLGSSPGRDAGVLEARGAP